MAEASEENSVTRNTKEGAMVWIMEVLLAGSGVHTRNTSLGTFNEL